MNKKNYISLANKAANLQIKELKKIKKVFNTSFIKAVDLILLQNQCKIQKNQKNQSLSLDRSSPLN